MIIKSLSFLSCVLNNGNIGAIDDLEYTYSGNQLVCVSDDANGPTYVGAMHFQDNSDEAVEYTYDENGRLTKDLNKKISLIQYNAVSLPSEVRFDDGSYITYLYDASGRKLRVDYHISPVVPLHPGTGPTPTSIGAGTVTGRADTGEASTASIPIIGPNPPIIPIRLDHTYTEYCGNHILENGLLTMTLIPGGYITYPGGSISAPSYHFYLCDHEGNNRIVTNINGNIEQANDYTPFGVLMKNDFTATSTQPYKYNGKELDRMHGLDLYDYGARLYDAPLGRWHVMDLLCEKYYNVSPYAYCLNNPVKFVDPDGKFAQKWTAELARFFYAKLHPNSSVSEVVTNDDTRNRRFRYTFNSVRTENDELVITSHSRLSKSTVKNVQEIGDAISIAGYALTLTYVGAETGIPMAAAGNAISNFGALCEIGLDFLNGDNNQFLKDFIYIGANKLINNKLGKLFPTYEIGKSEVNVGNSIVTQGASIKETIVEETIDMVIDENDKKH